MVTILMMSAKMAALVPLKIKVLLNKGYDVIISVHVTNKIYHVTQIILYICSRDQSFVTLAFLHFDFIMI